LALGRTYVSALVDVPALDRIAHTHVLFAHPRADTQVCPYVYGLVGFFNNCVKMVWHNDKRYYFYIVEFVFYFGDPPTNHFPAGIYMHMLTNNFPE
jgi:hypothetical protein